MFLAHVVVVMEQVAHDVVVLLGVVLIDVVVENVIVVVDDAIDLVCRPRNEVCQRFGSR